MTERFGVPAPSMSAEAVLRTLAEDPSDAFEEALASADAHREALVDRLLEALARGLADPRSASKEEASLFSYALYLLAKWREPRAYPYVIRWLSLPEEEPFDIAGDVVTQDGGRILAAVYDGNLEPITSLIVNRDALAVESADNEALEVFPELRRAYDEGLVDPQCIGPSELDEVETMPRGDMVRKMRERHPPISDVAAATAWWDRSSESDDDRGGYADDDNGWGRDAGEFVEVAEPYRAPPKIGRNESCPCGSGKKYKKCCGR